MNTLFEYRHLDVGRFGWNQHGASIAARISEGTHARHGKLFGLWAGQIGMWRDEGIVMIAWPDLDTARAGGEALGELPGSVEAPVYLEATVRPTDDEPRREPGFYAHRWFEIASQDWPEFLSLSDEAWPSMEAAVDARILGFWREVSDDPQATRRVLLLTWYRTLDDWERSRWWGKPAPGAEAAMTRFRRRTELVIRSRVTIATPAPS